MIKKNNKIIKCQFLVIAVEIKSKILQPFKSGSWPKNLFTVVTKNSALQFNCAVKMLMKLLLLVEGLLA